MVFGDFRPSGLKDFFVLDVVGQLVAVSGVGVRLWDCHPDQALSCPRHWRLLWRTVGIVAHPSGPRVLMDFFDPRVAAGFVCCAACVALVRFLGERL